MNTTQILDSISPRGYGREHPGRLRCRGCAPATAAPASGCPLTLPGPARPTPETPPEPTGPVLTIAIHQRESHALLQLAGELDMATACALHFQPRTTLAQNAQIVIDVAELSFTDMLGIGILCRASRSASRADGWIRLAGAQPRLQHVLALTHATHLLPLYETEYDATHDRH